MQLGARVEFGFYLYCIHNSYFKMISDGIWLRMLAGYAWKIETRNLARIYGKGETTHTMVVQLGHGGNTVGANLR